MCVPLGAGEDDRRHHPGIVEAGSPLDREDLLLAEDLAYRCALAADNARLYRARSEIARVLKGTCFRRTYPRSQASRSVPSICPSRRPATWEGTSTIS